jgi:broad specificity phosphatase PhoE
MKRTSTPSTAVNRGIRAQTPSSTLTPRKSQCHTTSNKGASISRAAAITPRKLMHSGIADKDVRCRTVYLIRHGQSKGQVASEHDRRFDESLTDCGLTDLGKEQAANIANLLSEIDLVICSPLTRALQTALIAFPEHSQIVCNYDLREVGSMIPENLPRKIHEVQADLQEWGLDVSKVDFESQKPNQWPNRHETPPKVVRRDRIRDVFVRLAEKLPSDIERIAVICHYHVIRTALSDPFDVKQSRDIQKTLHPKNAEPIRCLLESDGRLQISPEECHSDTAYL